MCGVLRGGAPVIKSLRIHFLKFSTAHDLADASRIKGWVHTNEENAARLKVVVKDGRVYFIARAKMLLPDRKYFAVDFFVNHRRVISALYLRNKKLPQRGAFCQSSQVLEDRRDFVARFALRSPPTRGSWYILKPVVAFHRYLRPFGQSTAQRRMTDLLHDPRFRLKPENTNSRYSTNYFITSALGDTHRVTL